MKQLTTRGRLSSRSWAPAGQSLDRNLIPLINVVFLMLIFFLLVGSIRSPDPQRIEPPLSTTENLRPADGAVIVVSADGQVWLDGAATAPAQLAARLSERWLDQSTRGLDSLRIIEIRADQNTAFSVLSDVLHVSNQSGADEVKLVTRR